MSGLEPLVIGLFLATVNERLVEYFIAPLFDKTGFDTFYLRYLAALTGGVIAWFAGVNLLGDYVSAELLARILSCVLVGGGSNLVHELFSNAAKRAESC